jgi:hypothetical protein
MSKNEGKLPAVRRAKIKTALATPGRSRLPAALPEAHGEAVRRDGGTTLVTGRAYVTTLQTIPAEQIFYVDGLKPRGDGPWIGEADKIAWRDEATGYECIVMRADQGGHLGGYVAVPRSHPLYGFERRAIPPELGIEVHGGLTYSRMCEHGPAPDHRIVAEARRICHVPIGASRSAPVVHATDYRVEDAHAWWLGFECNGTSDVVPGDDGHRARAAGVGITQVYRDDAYVCNEVLSLAAQLRAIEDGLPVPPRSGPPLPPLGPDPKRGS